MGEGQVVPGSLFVYAPNKVAPIIFAALYGLSAVGHIWQCFHYRSWKLIGLHPLCALLFTAGYAMREYEAYNYYYTSTTNLIVFVLSQVFIYVCPPLLELCNYHILGRIFYYVPYFAPLPPGRVLSTFGAIMAVVELLNALGVSLSANSSSSKSQQQLGSHLTVAAVAIQVCVIVIFMCLAGLFHYRCRKAKIHSRSVSTPLTILYISMLLILVRCIYRLVEHLGNTTVELDNVESLYTLSPILRYEWFFYVFEAVLMLINSVIWNIWNPSRFLPRDYHIYLSQDGTTEIEGPKPIDSRSLAEKIIHILSFGILFRKKVDNQQMSGAGSYTMANNEPQTTRDSRTPLMLIIHLLSFGVLLRRTKSDDRPFQELGNYPAANRQA